MGSPEKNSLSLPDKKYGIENYDQGYVDDMFSQWEKGYDYTHDLTLMTVNQVKMIQYVLLQKGYDLSYATMDPIRKGVDGDPGQKTHAAIEAEILVAKEYMVDEEKILDAVLSEEIIDVHTSTKDDLALLLHDIPSEDTNLQQEIHPYVHTLAYNQELRDRLAADIGLDAKRQAVIDKSFHDILGSGYDYVLPQMYNFVKDIDVPISHIKRLCSLWSGENYSFDTSRKGYSVVGQVSKTSGAWEEGFAHVGKDAVPFDHLDHYHAMIASYGYALRCKLFAASTPLALGKACMRYNLGSYSYDALALLHNQAPELRKKVVIAAGLDATTYDQDSVEQYVKEGRITPRDTAIGAQKYYMPDGLV